VEALADEGDLWQGGRVEMADPGIVEGTEHAGMGIAFDRVEHAARKQLKEALGRLADDMGAQAIDGVARPQGLDHAAHVVELSVHRSLQDLASGF